MNNKKKYQYFHNKGYMGQEPVAHTCVILATQEAEIRRIMV
jgi:hypothetical protein